MKTDNEILVATSRRIRQSILDMAFGCEGPAHLGGALSMVEIMVALYGRVLRFDSDEPNWQDRDRFILSKGHGVLAFYACLAEYGFFPKSDLATFKKNGSDLIAHPVMNLNLGIESSNGSLGHGISFATGISWALRRKLKSNHTYVLLGDGECEEGSVWEAAAAASKFSLNNLTAIVDANGLQSDGPVVPTNNARRISDKFEASGWNSVIVDGHDLDELCLALTPAENTLAPKAIVARTVKGKGVSYMENNNTWHHNRLTEENYLIGTRELSNG